MADREICFTGRRFDVVRETVRDEAGNPHLREFVCHPGAVTILPWVDDHRICLIRNVRPAVGSELIELPAGTLEEGEKVVETARRELQEETGYRAGKLTLLHEFWMSPGILNERMYLLAATDLSEGHMELDPGEQIRPWIVSWEEALELVRTKRIEDAKTIVGLLYYDRFVRAGECGRGPHL